MVARGPRYEAKQKGETTYFTGLPCRAGHIAPRFTSGGACSECIKARLTAKRRAKGVKRRQKQPEETYRAKRRVLDRAWKAKNRQRLRDESAIYYWANKETVDERNREYGRRNKEIAVHRAKLHKARRKGAEGAHTLEETRDLFRRQRGRCANCRTDIRGGYHEDHIMPLVRGGSNFISNIQLLCPTCNHRKHAKDPIAWAQEQGRLL